MTDLPRVVFEIPPGATVFFSRHPWVLAGAVERIEGDAVPGQPVDLVTDKGEWVARGLMNPESRLRIRLYSWDQAGTLDDAAFIKRLDWAIDLRETSSACWGDDSACRLVFSEGDALSGLIVDKYGPYLVVQPVAKVIFDRIEPLIARLVERLSPKGVLLKVDSAAARLEGGRSRRTGRLWHPARRADVHSGTRTFVRR